VAAHGVLIVFAWSYVLVLPSAPESQAVSHIYDGAPALHNVLQALRVWYAPLSGAAYVAIFTRKRMRDFIDPDDRCGVTRFERPNVG